MPRTGGLSCAPTLINAGQTGGNLRFAIRGTGLTSLRSCNTPGSLTVGISVWTALA